MCSFDETQDKQQNKQKNKAKKKTNNNNNKKRSRKCLTICEFSYIYTTVFLFFVVFNSSSSVRSPLAT